MSAWMVMKGALTAMDLVTRDWGRQLGLDECSTMVLALLGERDASAEWELARYSGRSRPHIHRALKEMARRGLVAPALVSENGRNKAWALTQHGEQLWFCLARGIQAWEEMLNRRVDLPELNATLQRVVEVCIEDPKANGWTNGLGVPLELMKVPLGLDAQLADFLSGERVARRQEMERAEIGWRAMWQRISG